jgi:hypothetical protein
MRQPVSTSAVAMIVSEPPSSMFDDNSHSLPVRISGEVGCDIQNKSMAITAEGRNCEYPK